MSRSFLSVKCLRPTWALRDQSLFHEHAVGIILVITEWPSTLIPVALVKRDGFVLQIPGLKHDSPAASSPSLIFQNTQNPAGKALPAEGRLGEHPLQLAVSRVHHQRPARHGLSIAGAGNGEACIFRRKRFYIDAMMTLSRVERHLISIKRFDEGDHFRLVG